MMTMHKDQGRPRARRQREIGPGMETAFTRAAGVEVPLIGGAMYPCSNPELVAAVSAAGGLGIVQPVSLTFVHKHEFRSRAALHPHADRQADRAQPAHRAVLADLSRAQSRSGSRSRSKRAFASSSRLSAIRGGWSTCAKPKAAVVYHDVTERKWADKAVQGGVDGLICVNNRAGGHAGDAGAGAAVQI